MTPAPIKPIITTDLLDQVDIRVGTIEIISEVAGSDKLVALRVNFGDHSRTIVAGLKEERSDPGEIVGKQALFVVNLQPRKMRGNPNAGSVRLARRVPPAAEWRIDRLRRVHDEVGTVTNQFERPDLRVRCRALWSDRLIAG